MPIQQFISRIPANRRFSAIFHFTSSQNLHSIRQHGLLSKTLLTQHGIDVPAPGGNEWSLAQDSARGLNDYISLSLSASHPMKYRLEQDGADDLVNLAIATSVLLTPGVKIAFGLANGSDIEHHDISDKILEVDMEVLYTRTDWRDSQIQERLQAAQKIEILVPHRIPVELITF